MQYDRNGNIENRTHNAVNEILSINNQNTIVHDRNGNMTLMPEQKGKYDAWNRLVEIRDLSDNLIARYDYNGTNQRIQKTIDNIVTQSFFNEEWQELESREPGTASPVTVYVWEKRYIDDLLYRERDEEKFYSLADPNWNVVAIIDSSGVTQERMKYDAFGKIYVVGQ
jgi:YD repeat-containing protein